MEVCAFAPLVLSLYWTLVLFFVLPFPFGAVFFPFIKFCKVSPSFKKNSKLYGFAKTLGKVFFQGNPKTL
jgi:hypothetical protein